MRGLVFTDDRHRTGWFSITRRALKLLGCHHLDSLSSICQLPLEATGRHRTNEQPDWDKDNPAQRETNTKVAFIPCFSPRVLNLAPPTVDVRER